MRSIYKIFLAILVICIPIASILAAGNIVLRIPDLYVYEFTNAQITNEINLGITDEELGGFFSDYMLMKKDNFDLYAEFRDREQSVFGTGEQIAMENARELLNKTLIGLGITILILVILYWLVLSKKLKPELRTTFKGGVIIFGLIGVISIILFKLPVSETIVQSIFVYNFGGDDVLPLMLTRKFAGDGLTAVLIASMVILAIIGSVTWKLTKPRRMFW